MLNGVEIGAGEWLRFSIGTCILSVRASLLSIEKIHPGRTDRTSHFQDCIALKGTASIQREKAFTGGANGQAID
jgi:hypothetical protein